MQILLAMTMYQMIVSGKLLSYSSSVPIIGQQTYMLKYPILEFHSRQWRKVFMCFSVIVENRQFYAMINAKTCCLYTLLTAMDRKKNAQIVKKAMLTTPTCG